MDNHNQPDMQLEQAIARLNNQLPLKARQQQLSPAVQMMHRQILLSLANSGRPPTREELRQVASDAEIVTGLRELGKLDLVVLDPGCGDVLGAYPLTCESTPHRVCINGNMLYAMCALDAVSVAPMFATAVRIDSSCHVSQTPISIRMQDGEYLVPESDMDAVVGIYWKMPGAVAAHSMCIQMVFLQDWPTARRWQATDATAISLFDLASAAAFGAAFFRPLLQP